MHPDSTEALLVRQLGSDGAPPRFSRKRIQAGLMLVGAGILLVVVMVLLAIEGVTNNGWVLFGLWQLAGILFWSGVFVPFRLGWVGVFIGVISQFPLAAILFEHLMSRC
jgi:hypothetical protein